MERADQPMLTDAQIKKFLSRCRLPASFNELIDKHYLPLAEWLVRRRSPGRVFLLGINGAQGTGKSTLASFLEYALEEGAGWRTAVLSIDDFYLGKEEREKLGVSVHPLLRTRGVPGTHDLEKLARCIKQLRVLEDGVAMPLPRFDKSKDDCADPDLWPIVTGPVDQIILEGWCVGSRPQPDESLQQPVNSLEETSDASGEWRRYANEQLAGGYQDIFRRLDALVFLQVPDFDAVYRWRLEQEHRLAAQVGQDGHGIMNSEKLAGFIQYFERLTMENMAVLPKIADVVLELNKDHECVRSFYARDRDL